MLAPGQNPMEVKPRRQHGAMVEIVGDGGHGMMVQEPMQNSLESLVNDYAVSWGKM